jgi:L-iditol 2-dehydrogenase
MRQNKGLVIETPGVIKLVGLPLESPKADEVLVGVKYVALCGSDKKLYLGSYTGPHKYPITIGHEWVGEVVQAGAGAAEQWRSGDLVTGDCSVFCGTCGNCRIDRNHCAGIEKTGITVDGACSQYFLVDRRHIYRCPQLPDPRVFALSEPLAVVVQGVVNRITREDLKLAGSALIVGAGGIGSMALCLLAALRVPKITIVDTVQERLDVVASLGYPNVAVMRSDLAGSPCQPNEGFDLIIEAAGSSGALARAVELANPCAKIVCIGHQQKAEMDAGMVVRKSLTVIGSHGGTGGFERAIKIIEENWTSVAKMITKVVPLGEAEEFFRSQLESGKETKVLIDLSG